MHLDRGADRALPGCDHDAIDEGADGFAGGGHVVGGEGSGQVRDSLAVDAGEAGVERDDLLGGDLRQLGVAAGTFRLGLGQRFGNVRRIDPAIGERRDQARDAGVGIGPLPFDAPAVLAAALRLLGPGGAIFLDISGDQVGVQKALRQAGQHAPFERCTRDRPPVAAGQAVAMVAAAPAILADDAPGATAGAAHGLPRQQVARPPDRRLEAAGISPQLRLGSVPQIVVDDPQLGHIDDRPFAFRVDPQGLPAADRVLHLAGAVVDQLPAVKVVAEDAVAALGMAMDGADPPQPAAGRWHSMRVQPGDHGANAPPLADLLEDAAHDRGLVRVDFAKAGHRLAPLVEAPDLPVAVGHAAGVHASKRSAALTAADIVGGVLALLLVDQRLDRALEAVELPIGEAEQAGTVEGEQLAQAVEVAEVASDAARGVGEHLVDAAGLDALQQRGHAGPLPLADAGAAADRIIGKDVDDGPALAVAAGAAVGELVVDRAVVLKVA